MRNISFMCRRIAYMREQAAEFRRLGEHSADPLRAQFFDLALRCDEIAVNIERNLPIHAAPD